MTASKKYKLLTLFIATVWFINGLLCKVINLEPRHEEIVGRILSTKHSRSITLLIGILEIIMAIWIVSGWKSKLNTMVQIAIIGIMNIIELNAVPELLLWGKWNSVFALLFIILIYYNGFYLKSKSDQQLYV